MALPGQPLVLYPGSVTDAISGSNVRRGSMSLMSNLIPDPSTSRIWYCRPAATLLHDLGVDLPGLGFISVIHSVGTRIYGMAASHQFSGRDEPFCFDVQTQEFIPITATPPPGTLPATPPPVFPLTAAMLPFSPLTTGPWNPPSMTVCGSNIIIAHPGYNSAGGVFFGAINTLVPSKPTYKGTNTASTPLIFPPQWVSTFNGRVFYTVNPPGQQPGIYMSDSLNALTITNANQILTFGDNIQLTVTAGLALNNQLGGVVQSLMVFKGVTGIYQVTGDYALGNLAINNLNVATGTLGANTVVGTEKGLMFMAPDGIRLIDFQANVADPIGSNGQGVTIPFYNAQVPSRCAAAFNGGVYRIQVQNMTVPTPTGNAQQEWWLDMVRGCWSGPHTTNVSLIVPQGTSFVATLQGVDAKLWRTDHVQTVASNFVENGKIMLCAYRTTFFPEDDMMSELCTVETTIHMQLPPLAEAGSPWSSGFSPGFGNMDPGRVGIAFVDHNEIALDAVSVQSLARGSLWGHMIWGVDRWGGPPDNMFPRRLKWHHPIVFRRGALVLQAIASSGFRIGEARVRVQELGYLQMDDPGLPGNAFVLDHSKLDGPDFLLSKVS